MQLTFHSQNDVFNLEIAAANTQYQANTTSMAAFSVLIDADLWMSFYNSITGVAHWDYVRACFYHDAPYLLHRV